MKNHKSLLNNELTFVITCCKINLSKNDIDFILFYLNAQSLNINALVSLTSKHGVLPLVYQTLKKIQSKSNSHNSQCLTLCTMLKSQYLGIVQRNMFMSSELIRIMKILEENDIKVLSFKGPSLSQIAYGNITLRQYSDLDILIKKEDRDKICKILESQGYQQMLILTSVQKKNWYKHAKDMTFLHTKKSISIELHWLLLDNDYPIQVDLESIWEHPQSVVINRQNIQTFSTESLLVYLCIHGSKHLWERIEWIKDIDLIIRTQTIDWNLIADEVSKSDFKRMFLLGLYLSHSLFKTPLPDIFKEEMKHQNWLIKLSDFVITDWEVRSNMFYNSLAMIHLFPSIKMKLRYLHKVIFKPSKSEYRFVNFPRGLYWAYYLVRPYLLIKKYLTKK